MKSYDVRCINEEILKMLDLKKRYEILNAQFMGILDDKQKDFLNKVERFCRKYDKKVDHTTADVYDWIPDFGEQGYITRSRAFSEFDLDWNGPDGYTGLTADLIRALALDQFNPQFNMGAGATVLCVNPLAEHHENQPHRLEALKELITGQAIGCIMITEPEVGSDAVRPLTRADPQEDGSFLITGEKIYSTNGPKSKYGVFYAATEPGNSKTVMQGYFQFPTEGITIKRVGIPWVPKLFLGQELMENALCPKENVLGPVGAGKAHMFEGLNLERMGIAILDVAEIWTALTHGLIYVNMREQMGQIILKHQGVGFLLTEAWSKAMNFTMACLRFCEKYDAAVEKYGGTLPRPLETSFIPIAHALKYRGAILAERISYEVANVMGGAGVCDNTLMQDLLGISRIQEIIGGTRQIQQYVMSMSFRQFFKMI
ncbi:MAG: acyl-CoA/acyl-ACP dehydrogenase [Candidatus Lokiarchaeota archaeon]|nr:acyl-CoA/acyl-ACP dehydrogenase [Candidatus Lokiarchaeota archaeon]